MSADLSRWIDRVTQGDCLDVLRELPDCSVDLCRWADRVTQGARPLAH